MEKDRWKERNEKRRGGDARKGVEGGERGVEVRRWRGKWKEESERVVRRWQNGGREEERGVESGMEEGEKER